MKRFVSWAIPLLLAGALIALYLWPRAETPQPQTATAPEPVAEPPIRYPVRPAEPDTPPLPALAAGEVGLVEVGAGVPHDAVHEALEPPDAEPLVTEAVTDADGRYSLELVLGGEGATVGKNRVSISTYQGVEDPATGQGKVLAQETVPEKYRGPRSTLSFVVPPEGTTEANFDLKSK